ncbi:MAG: tRNA uridine-5-carboxymethylaminomethyl(34) synthesis GTPase MnmE [Oscillospiraceae bacterium]
MPDTIAAIATAPAAAAVGIVRLSGVETRRVLAALFTPVNGRSAAELPPRRMTYGTVRDAEGRTLDHALAVVFSAGHSYTGEESAELHCHGSPVVLQEVLRAAFAAGARQARAGEFTERAFLNGKMDLTEAEAVIDLIDAETAEAARNAAAQVDGALRRPLEQVYDALLGLTSRFYAVVDYPDEDIEDLTLAETERTLTESEQTLTCLSTFARGRVLKSGAATAIVGAPNAGKSSLLNALVGYDRAIVTDLPGTTRDTVEEKAVVGGVLLRLIDTAGIRETDDAVERLGVERSRRAVESADLVIVVADGSHTPLTVEPDILALAAQAPHWILAISKDDRNPAVKTAVWRLPDGAPVPEHLVSFNSVMPGGLDALIDTIRDCFPAGVPAGGTLLTNARQAEAVDRALNAVRAAHEALTAGLTPDVVLTEAEGALDALGELTGRTAREDMVTRIFERFCVGK